MNNSLKIGDRIVIGRNGLAIVAGLATAAEDPDTLYLTMTHGTDVGNIRRSYLRVIRYSLSNLIDRLVEL